MIALILFKESASILKFLPSHFIDFLLFKFVNPVLDRLNFVQGISFNFYRFQYKFSVSMSLGWMLLNCDCGFYLPHLKKLKENVFCFKFLTSHFTDFLKFKFVKTLLDRINYVQGITFNFYCSLSEFFAGMSLGSEVWASASLLVLNDT